MVWKKLENAAGLVIKHADLSKYSFIRIPKLRTIGSFIESWSQFKKKTRKHRGLAGGLVLNGRLAPLAVVIQRLVCNSTNEIFVGCCGKSVEAVVLPLAAKNHVPVPRLQSLLQTRRQAPRASVDILVGTAHVLGDELNHWPQPTVGVTAHERGLCTQDPQGVQTISLEKLDGAPNSIFAEC